MGTVMWVQPHFRVSAIHGWSMDRYSRADIDRINRFEETGLVDDLPENLRGGALEWAEPFKSNVIMADE